MPHKGNFGRICFSNRPLMVYFYIVESKPGTQGYFSVKIPGLIKYGLAIIPIVWIFWHINFLDLVSAAKKMAPWTVPVYTAVILSSMSLQGVRWWMLARAFIPTLSFSRVMACQFAGIFYSIVLPGIAGQDVVRALLLSKGNDYSVVWGATWVARILGLLVLALVSLYGLFTLNKNTLPPGFLPTVASAFAVLVLLFLASFSKRFTGPGRIALRKILPGKFLGILENIREAIYKFRDRKSTIAYVSLVTLLMQFLLVAQALFAIKGITGKWLLPECLAYIPLIELICTALPFTPSGLGIREALVSLMFLHIGLSSEQLGVYLLIGFYAIALKLTGVVPVLFGWTSPPEKK